MLQKELMRFLLVSPLLLQPVLVLSQDCNIHLNGRIVDEHDNSQLSYATIYIEELNKNFLADSAGTFIVNGLCQGDYHLAIAHIQCETQRLLISIATDTTITFFLEHHSELLSTITIEADRPDPVLSQSVQVLNSQSLDKVSGKSLGDVIEQTNGVTLIKTGPAIVKPVIHGLYGTRLVIVNNGSIQEGQNWGNEHAPEIDPFSTNKISVIKGTAAVKYGSEAMGGAIVLEPAKLGSDRHIHGAILATAATNNGLMSFAGHIQGGLLNSKNWRFRLQGGMKYAGDANTPNYRLTNTGIREQSISLRTEGQIGKVETSVYYSFFNTELGILRGSHIGNTTDLENALMRDVPLFTGPFSYKINNPRQGVTHHLARIEGQILTDHIGRFKIAYGFQKNGRKEYDIRRGGRSDKPALDMDLTTNTISTSWDHPVLSDLFKGEIGFNWSYQENRNDPETGVSPLIPWYNENSIGLYLFEKIILSNFVIEFGARYDYRHLLVKTFDEKDNLLEPEHDFHNVGASLGWIWNQSSNLVFRTHLGFAKRNANISELYSDGLHHGAAAYEEGDPNLNMESALKWSTGLTWNKSEKVNAEIGTYVHFFDDYIQLEPQDEFVLTIRGAFPFFKYVQQDARIWGIDAAAVIEIWDGFHWEPSYSLIRSKNLEKDIPLFFIPSDRLQNRFHFQWDAWGKIIDPELSFSGTYVWEQTRAPEEGDFSPPPPGYFLVDVELGGRWIKNDKEIKYSIVFTNLLNEAYRDYMNRLRYFADDTGINIEFRIKYSF